MLFHPTGLEGAHLIEPEKRGDDRGFFARIFCKDEFGKHGLKTDYVQANNSLTGKCGTLRGMHYQLGQHSETKLVRCIRGALWDCILDLRPESANFGQWFGAELSAENRMMMYVPKGFAHGFLTLTDNVEAIYLVDAFYEPNAERIVRWSDSRFHIEWPSQPISLSEKDANAPDFDPRHHLENPSS
ncbi:dTDP-4-dehydrorhamnose 3,5-epimerase [Aeoliella sp.]|uniref:dTDP-4-dehydrorhamnose 3,5-epimerase n=1 Tax=Aeoliella sp. TaxID=2795800 RepID=UPI003CCBD412